MSRAADERREEFARYKEDVEERGKPFFPYAMFHDTVMSLVVVSRDHRALRHLEVHGAARPRGRGLARDAVLRPGRPGTTTFVPRPDWYFYFLFYLLRIFETRTWSSSARSACRRSR